MTSIQRDQLFGLPVGGGEINLGGGGAAAGVQVRQLADQLVRFVDARLGLGAAGPGTAAQPFQFRVHAIGEGVLPLSLRVEVLFFLLQKPAVVSFDAEHAVHIDAIEFHHLARNVFQKVAIVADDDARERRVLKQGFKPLNPGKVQMVGGLVEKQNVRAAAPAPR